MPNYVRWKSAGSTYFFTVVTYRRRPLFADARCRRLLGASFRIARKQLPYEIDSMVLLPDHLHVLMRSADGVDYSSIWKRIKSVFTGRLLDGEKGYALRQRLGAARRKGGANVWHRRFYEHTIRDEDDWGRHVDYIHWNPVKHGLVRRPQDWKWSSIHRYIATGLLVPDWPGREELDLPVVEE